MKFWANENGIAPGTPGAVPLQRYFVRDEWGNEYIIHASGKDTPAEVEQAFDAAVLPPGWTKSKRRLSEDLVLHGAGGDDTLRPGRGNDEVWGDAGKDTVELPGRARRYRLASVSDGGRTVVLRRGAERKTIRDAERLRFKDRSVKVASLKSRDAGRRL